MCYSILEWVYQLPELNVDQALIYGFIYLGINCMHLPLFSFFSFYQFEYLLDYNAMYISYIQFVLKSEHLYV